MTRPYHPISCYHPHADGRNHASPSRLTVEAAPATACEPKSNARRPNRAQRVKEIQSAVSERSKHARTGSFPLCRKINGRCGVGVALEGGVTERERACVASNTQMDTHRVAFASCDLCEDLAAPVNAEVALAMRCDAHPPDLVVCAYCLVENAVALRRHRFRFLRALLQQAGACCTALLLLDSSWKLWCAVCDDTLLRSRSWSCSCSRCLVLVWEPRRMHRRP